MEPPSPTTSSLASESDIEMISLDELPVSPKPYTPGDTSQSLPDDHDSDDDDGGERALLGENTETRWREKTPSGFWKQTSGIVVEVSVSSLRSSVSDHGTLDTTNAPFHNNGQSVYGEAVR
jgi:hypothetical protein